MPGSHGGSSAQQVLGERAAHVGAEADPALEIAFREEFKIGVHHRIAGDAEFGGERPRRRQADPASYGGRSLSRGCRAAQPGGRPGDLAIRMPTSDVPGGVRSGGRLRVLSYEDEASGIMSWDGESYRFGEVVLRSRVVIEEGGDPALAEELHHMAHGLCFIARSVKHALQSCHS
jgi:hypothetical protein